MGESEATTSKSTTIAGAEIVTVNLISIWGPFAKGAALLTAPPTPVSIVNISRDSASLSAVTMDPAHLSHTGASVPSNLGVEPTTLNIAAGESAVTRISGGVPAAPGVYVSTLRAVPAKGSPLGIPVEFRVSAWTGWGFLCMVLGLLLVALVDVLGGESDVQSKLRSAYLARQSVRELLQQTPPPQTRESLVENIDREFEAAIEILKKPREASFVDHRGEDAQEHLKTAAELTAELRKALSERPRGGWEVENLEREWRELKGSFAELSALFLVAAPTGPSLTERLGAFDAWAAQRLLRPSMDFYSSEFASHIAKVQLMYDAGRGQAAAAEATAVRRWMQRAADSMDKSTRLLMFFIQQSANDLTAAKRIRQHVEAQEVPAERRNAILKSLDNTASLLSEPLNWPARRMVELRIQEART